MRKRMIMLCSFILLVTFATAFSPSVGASGEISEGSGIAGITLGGMNREEAAEMIHEHIVEWQSKDPLEAHSDYETVLIPRDIFRFDVEATLDELEQRTKREWTNFFLKRKNVQIPLQVEVNSKYYSELNWNPGIDIDATLDHAAILASNLMDGEIVIKYKETANFETVQVAEVSLPLPEASRATILRLAEELNEEMIHGEDVFSFLDRVALPAGMADSELEMSFVASLLYQSVLHTELEVIERHPSPELPEYTDPGLEAVVDRISEKNLLIYNPSNHTYNLEAEVVGKELFIALHTTVQEKSYKYTVQNEKEIKPRTIYRYSDELTGDEQLIQREGRPGLQLEIHRESLGPGGIVEDTKLISKDFYPPVHRVIQVAYGSELEDEEAERIDESISEPEQATPRNPTIFNETTLEERLNELEACEGDTDCEEALGLSPAEKLITACFIESFDEEPSIDGEPGEQQESNPLCDLLFVAYFFYLMNNEGLPALDYSEEQLSDVDDFLNKAEEVEQEDDEEVE